MTDLLIVDLDDTLWEWCTTWRAGYVEFNRVLIQHGVSKVECLETWQSMYQRINGVTIEEPPFAVDLVSVTGMKVAEAESICAEALKASRLERDSQLATFGGVADTLIEVARRGIPIVAHTDAPVSAATYRMTSLGLDAYIAELHANPLKIDFGEYTNDRLHIGDFDSWKPKPDSSVIHDILDSHHVSPARALYVGDSLRRDMSMAASVGLRTAWARYGNEYSACRETVAILREVHALCPRPASDYAPVPETSEHHVLTQFSDVVDVL